MDLKNKRVLLVGLGLLGGGLSTAKYLLDKGAVLTITDLRDEKTLSPTIKQLSKIEKKRSKINYVLGENKLSNLKEADIIVLNPAVSDFSPLTREIKKLGREYYNDYTFFLKELGERSRIIGVTGTRGKTTISGWVNQLLEDSVLGGNTPEASLFKVIEEETSHYVLELSSYQLEHLTKKHRSPNIAILTNIYVDHLNRYGTLKRYADVKKMIYANQKKEDSLILSNDEPITREVEKEKPKSRLYYVSLKPLPSRKDGLYFSGNKVFRKKDQKKERVGEAKSLAPHEKYNLLFSVLTADLCGLDPKTALERVKKFGNPPSRQEVIYNRKGLKIINDSTGTSPEATIAAIEKFKEEGLYLITGGTDKKLDYSGLAKKIVKNVNQNQLYLLSGSGTNKLIKKLPVSFLYRAEVREFESLEKIVKTASEEAQKGTLLFSPGAASFEKFKNEFDRAEQFNKLVKKYFK